MNRLFVLAHRFPALRMRSSLLLSLAAAVLFGAAANAQAQYGASAPGTQVHDATALKPPAGARVAIVEFADMECPACANANPILKAAAATYKIPWLRHDFLIPYHVWSPQATVNARWFDGRGKAVGDEYRDLVFANQTSIYNLAVLRQFTEKFAADRRIALPFAIDPQGKLAAEVKADSDLGMRTGVKATPAVWIVTDHSKGAPYMEVADGMGNLYKLIDQALADTAPAKPAPKTPVKKPASK